MQRVDVLESGTAENRTCRRIITSTCLLFQSVVCLAQVQHCMASDNPMARNKHI